MTTPAIAFEPDGFVLEGHQIMGRRAAGHAFLRGLVDAHRGGELTCYTPSRRSAEVFGQEVHRIDPAMTARWIAPSSQGALARVGGLYLADPRLARMARTRLRVGSDAYYLTGVTHTLCTAAVEEMLAELVTGPVMAWDALVCTSSVARSVVERIMERQAEYLAWRTGAPVTVPRPMLPVIPLGVHTADFAADEARKAAGRQRLGLGGDEVAFLFAGRLSFHAKAHPFQMLRGLAEANRVAAKPLVLVLAGQFFHAKVADAFRSAIQEFAPGLKVVLVDGADEGAYRDAWRASDVFVSLSDNIQETFGITPIEAMAAGMPLIVSDWNGYKDTVRDGVDGFRIPSWAPAAGGGAQIAQLYETDMVSLDRMASMSSTAVSVDVGVLRDRLVKIADDADFRAGLGQAGRERARTRYDWAAVIGEYQALWAEQAAVLAHARQDERVRAIVAAAPREAAPFLDPTDVFASYPTEAIDERTLVTLLPGGSIALFDRLTAHVSLENWNPPRALVEQWLAALGAGAASVGTLAMAAGLTRARAIDAVGRLAKLELVRLEQPAGASEPLLG